MIIYKATNTNNGKVYIGQTTASMEYRMNQHRNNAMNNHRYHTYFHNAIRKHGFESFTFEIIDTATNIDELNKKEQFWIAYYKSTDRQLGYNLDSGGRNCQKSESTKRKIGDTTLLKWRDERTAQKMREGLVKGTEKWKTICNSRRVAWKCPVCGKELFLPPHIARQKKYCSSQCSNIGNKDVLNDLLHKAIETNCQRKILQNHEISSYIYQWVAENKEIVLTCPKNKISTTLQELQELIYQRFGVKDWRTIAESVGVYYKKDLLLILQDYIYENLC